MLLCAHHTQQHSFTHLLININDTQSTMKLTIKDAQSFTIPGGTKGFLYSPGPDKAYSIAIVTMDGVYPEKGWSINDICTETMYLQSGKLTVNIENDTFILEPGDMISVLPGKKYQVRGIGETIDVITPAWVKEQNHIIETQL